MTEIRNGASALSRRKVLRAGLGLALGSGALGAPMIRAAGRDTIRIGYIAPLSGLRAPFTVSTRHTLDVVRQALKDGLTVGGRTYDVEIIVKDCQSTPARSVQVGNELLLKDKPDIILVADAEAATAIGPIADARRVPTLSTFGPWQAWAFSRKYDPKKGFPYTFHFFFGADELGRAFPAMWDHLDTNHQIGALFADNDAGRVMSNPEIGFPPAFEEAGYTFASDTGLFRLDTDDFSTQIADFKRKGVDIVAGTAYENHMATFWNQAAQMGFQPKVCTIASGLLFPSSVTNLGDRGQGMSTEAWWTPEMPFTSSLTGQSAAEVAQAFEAAGKQQWTQPLGYEHALLEIGINALRTSSDPKDHDAVRDALANSRNETVVGTVDFAGSPLKSVGLTHTVGGQWQQAKAGAYRYQLQIVDNSTNPAVNVTADFMALNY
ncbi:ABC transporter substrate-binding protein [Pseudooceanicola sp. CBS1P-1]|uniref:ABC transporter substrate-binding protein n=1 Tax=Pseudooceanicola albus TaxID=2692189 RepID=A0A6L7GDY6_9RHOB|nr:MULTISPECIES: ABC transporter substrate-binding protein [Pseudooceanicola]MBT9386775.1 ABC transporter substrate-binding protein [Pseudooceanicola endophyticus]MXN20963.1 ABC transporter substrate-binding protein [Pseudooceanicola albus]